MLVAILLGTLAGVVGTGIGGIIGVVFVKKIKNVLDVLMSISAGIMLSLVSFELMPNSIDLGGVWIAVSSFLFGVCAIVLCEDIFFKKMSKRQPKATNDDYCVSVKSCALVKPKKDLIALSFLKTGIMMFIAIMLHNLPEGLVVGASISSGLGYTAVFLIAVHDIPEGIVMTAPLKAGGMSGKKAILLSLLSGVSTVIGSFIGFFVGSFSDAILATCYGMAGGAMFYVICAEIFFKNSEKNNSIAKAIWCAVGLIFGFTICSL